MPFQNIKLNDRREIPGIGFGTANIPVDICVDNIELALRLGYRHFDTSQAYDNEELVGLALKQSKISRQDCWVTTKCSGSPFADGDSIGARDSLSQSLSKLGLECVDLYLIHTPRLVRGRMAARWNEFMSLQKEGLTRSIGISNFTIEDLDEMLYGDGRAPEVLPAVCQIELHPYVWKEQRGMVEYCQSKGIAVAAWSPLRPLTAHPGGPVDKPVYAIAARLGIKPEQVLLAWVRSKGAIVLSTSTKEGRLRSYLEAADFDLTGEDVRAIEVAGAGGRPKS